MIRRRLAFGLALAFSCGSALAHPGHQGDSLLAGVAHPLLGVDHLLTMLAVGLYAAQQKGAGRWALPLTFVLSMLAGALAGVAGLALPLVEGGVAASVLVLGLLLALAVRLPLAAALPLVGFFAIFHGHAHFVEMGHQAMLSYALGFAAAAAVLHLAGFMLSRWLPQGRAGRALKRVLGCAIAGTGMVLLGA